MRQPIPRRQPRFRYQGFFHGYCYYSSNFGHKIANCAFKFRSMQLRMPNNDELLQHRTRKSLSNQQLHATQFTIERRTHNKHTNPFHLLYNEPECYICHNYGHKALECHLKNYRPYSRMNYSTENVKVGNNK